MLLSSSLHLTIRGRLILVREGISPDSHWKYVSENKLIDERLNFNLESATGMKNGINLINGNGESSNIYESKKNGKSVRFDAAVTQLTDHSNLKGEAIPSKDVTKFSTIQRSSSANPAKQQNQFRISAKSKFETEIEVDPYFTEKDYLHEKKKLLQKINSKAITVSPFKSRYQKDLNVQIFH